MSMIRDVYPKNFFFILKKKIRILTENKVDNIHTHTNPSIHPPTHTPHTPNKESLHIDSSCKIRFLVCEDLRVYSRNPFQNV